MTLLGIIAAQELIVIIIVICIMFLIPVIALVDIVRSKFEGNRQLMWVLVVFCFDILGSILYFAIGKNQKIKQ